MDNRKFDLYESGMMVRFFSLYQVLFLRDKFFWFYFSTAKKQKQIIINQRFFWSTAAILTNFYFHFMLFFYVCFCIWFIFLKNKNKKTLKERKKTNHISTYNSTLNNKYVIIKSFKKTEIVNNSVATNAHSQLR